jgi:hypothetical protein
MEARGDVPSIELLKKRLPETRVYLGEARGFLEDGFMVDRFTSYKTGKTQTCAQEVLGVDFLTKEWISSR